jgi:hypothetical protein
MSCNKSEERNRLETCAAQSLVAAGNNWDNFMTSMQVFHAHAQDRNVQAAEAKRAILHVLLDDYIDQYLVAARITAQLEGKSV